MGGRVVGDVLIYYWVGKFLKIVGVGWVVGWLGGRMVGDVLTYEWVGKFLKIVGGVGWPGGNDMV